MVGGDRPQTTDDRVTVLLTGRDLDRAKLVRVAREREPVALDPAALERMAVARRIVEAALDDGRDVYGLSTAVGVLKRVRVEADAAADYSRRMIPRHAVAQGPTAAADHVRAMTLRLANSFAQGSTGV